MNTSNNTNLVKVTKNIYWGGDKWIKEVKYEIWKSFKKIRVSTKKEQLSKNKSELFKEKERLTTLIVNHDKLNSNDMAQLESKLKVVEDAIAEMIAEETSRL